MSEENKHNTNDTGTPYTVFTKPQKNTITFVLGYTTIASALTATSYLPLLPLLSAHFQVSAQSINLTITLYTVFQAISPILFATTSDTLGRRPVFLVLFAVYTLASLGLSLNRESYAALLVLRALQSLGASCGIALSYGVVADIAPPSDRGKMLGPVLAISNLGSCIGPLVGGAVAFASGGFVWPFWCLTIYGGTAVLVVGFLMPETARQVVGNGSRRLDHWWEKTWWRLLTEQFKWAERRRQGTLASPQEVQSADVEGSQVKLKFGNVLQSIKIIFQKDTAITLWMAGSYYAVYYLIQASLPPIFDQIYDFNELEIGASFVAGAGGVIAGGYVNGRLIDHAYKKTAKEIGRTIDRVAGDDLRDFPIEKARVRTSWYWIVITMAALIGYGWSAQEHSHVSVPLILQFVLGFTCTCMLQAFSTLLVDVFPNNPSTASTAGNIVRYGLSAAGVAILQPLVDVMGRGYFFTLIGLVSGCFGVVVGVLLYVLDMKWRQRRCEKEAKSSSSSGGTNDNAEARAEAHSQAEQEK